MSDDLRLPGGAPAPEPVLAAARAALVAHFGPPPEFGSHGCSVGEGVGSGPGEWTVEVRYSVDPDHASQYDKSTSYVGLGVFRQDPPGGALLRIVSGTLQVEDNGTNYLHSPGERVSLLDLAGG